MHETLTKLADEVKALWMATDSLNSFTSWPDDLIANNTLSTTMFCLVSRDNFFALLRNFACSPGKVFTLKS